MKGKYRVMVLDNSIATTGAYRSALAMVRAIDADAETVFVLPKSSALLADVVTAGHRCHALPMVEIGRSASRLLAYVPMLVVNGFRLRRLLARERIDVLVANDYYNLLPAMARVLGWRGRIVTIVRLMPKMQQPVLNRVWIAAMQFAANRVVAVSKAVEAQLPPDAEPETVYFPVGRGLEALPYREPPAQNLSDSTRFLYLANYIPGKGQAYALSAFAELTAAYPNARLRFVGGDMGLAMNGAYLDSLVLEAARLGIDGYVEFDGPVDDVISAIEASDVVLNFSDSESFSHTCVEAGLLGRPVIATRCGGPEEIVLDGITGLLVDRQDVPSMAAAMLRLGEAAKLRKTMGETAYRWTRQHFGEAGFATTMQRVLAPRHS